MDLLIGFLTYTHDAVVADYQNSSKLDLTVLEALDFQDNNQIELVD